MFLEFQQQLDDRRPWLAEQPRFQGDWEAGCKWVSELCQTWAKGYLGEFLVESVSEDVERRCELRLWCAWSHHWMQASARSSEHRVDGLCVAELLRSERRPTDQNKRLGGNPLRDAVLVEACLAGSIRAVQRLQMDYRGLFEEESHRTLGRVSDPDLWDDLVSRLIVADRGSVRGTGKLASYVGYSALSTWLRQVIRHSLWDSYRRQRVRRLAEQHATFFNDSSYQPTPGARLELSESLQCLHAALARAFVALASRERIILFLSCRQKWPNRAIAQFLGRSAGQMSRLRSEAIEHLRAHLHAELASERKEAVMFGPWEEEGWTEDPETFASFLLRGLSEALPWSDDAELVRIKSTLDLEAPSMILTKVTPNVADREVSKPIVRKRSDAMERMDALVTNNIEMVTPLQNPSEFFEMLHSRPRNARPSLICLDGRVESISRVIEWLQQVDAILYEQFNERDTDERMADWYEPLRVVLVAGKSASQEQEEWRTRPDICWIETEDSTTDAARVYRDFLRKEFESLIRPSLPGSLTATEADDVIDPEKLVPKAKRASWRALVKSIESWRNEDNAEIGS